MEDGWTSIELLAAVAVVATLATIAIPQFGEIAANARRADRVNALVRSLHAARSAAILRAQPIALCASSDRLRCTPGAADWSAGWIVFANVDRRMPPQVDADDEILHAESVERPRVRVTANRPALVYWPLARGGTTASILFCDERGERAARAIIISSTGRPRLAEHDASGQPLRCP